MEIITVTMISISKMLRQLATKVNSSDGIIVSVGIFALITGVLVDAFIVRLVCLFIVLGSAVLTYALLRAKRLDSTDELRGASSRAHSQHESDEMKKLVFDDFQSHAGERYVVGEVHEENIQSTQSPEEQGESISREEQFLAPGPQIFASMKSGGREALREFQISDFFDVDSDIYRGDPEPRAEFNFLLNKVLTVIKEVLFAHSVAFFWANREKQQMVLESRVSDSAGFVQSRRFAIGQDLVSNVAESGKPELITDVNPLSESELLLYYDHPESIKSFVGVPVYFSNVRADHSPAAVERPVAVLAVDSKAADEFGQETLALLGQFTKLVSALIKSYTDKYDLLLDSELLRSIRRLQERIRSNFSMYTIVQSLAEETSKLVSWDYLSVVLYDESKRSWVAKKVTCRAHESYIMPEQAIDFPESIVAQTIKNNTHGLINELGMAASPRFHSAEKLDKRGSFISVPISSLNKCYGALNVESRDPYNFSRQDIDILYRLADNAASALEILYMQEVINEYVIIDEETGVYSKKFFLQKIEEELQRADDNGLELSLLFLTVDKSNEIIDRFGKEGFERVMWTLAKAVRASVRSYDIVGRHDLSRFGVILVNTTANDAYLWAEKIRKSIAGHVIDLDGKSFSVTVSAGVCGALEGMRKEELLGNTLTVINRASEAGGNAVRVF